MAIDWEASKEDWIARVRGELFPRLLADQRFVDAGKLTARFDHEVAVWQKNGVIRQVIEIGNELAAAAKILTRLQDDDSLQYEPPISGTKKRLDFLRQTKKGEREWIEVKTVAPLWMDTEEQWQKYLLIAQEFPENAKLVVAKEWEGAAISGQAIKARLSLVNRTLETEARAALIPDAERGPVTLVFCSTGFAWHRDDLEDFADYYRSGKFRQDDWSRAAICRYMGEQKLSFARSLAGFHYLARKHEDVDATEFFVCVRGPKPCS